MLTKELVWEIQAVRFSLFIIEEIKLPPDNLYQLGPLVAGGQVIGVVSWGIACARGK